MKTRRVINSYTSAQLLDDYKVSNGKPVRYAAYEVRLPFWRTLWLLARYWIWCRVERIFVPIFPGQPGYDEAVYEAVKVNSLSSLSKA